MSERVYPDKLEVRPLERPPNATVRVPGSKSITNRALVLAALAEPESESQLDGVLRSEDTELMVDALRALGFRLKVDWPNRRICVRRDSHQSPIPSAGADIFVGNSGTTMRFLTAMVCLGTGRFRLDGVARMRERPIGDLLVALKQLGARIRCEGEDGFPPIVVDAAGLVGGRVQIRGNTSSQFLSALLMASPLALQKVSIEVDGLLVSEPYVKMTVTMMEQFRIKVANDSEGLFRLPARSWYRAQKYEVEPDASAASYFFAAAAITDGAVTIPGLSASSIQGDILFAERLDEMGCIVYSSDENIIVGKDSHQALAPLEVDMNAISDTVMTLAAVACFADGPTTIRNVAHIRHKETDRLAALATELRRLGAEVDEFADGLTITPRPLHGAEVETYNDHRMAMSLALIGLKVPGVVIKNPGCVAKTYPGFWDDLEKLRG
jgi:3-phosphoshikimate 1-carboxyvinyltransferase